MNNNRKLSIDEYFKSEQHKLIFALVFSETTLREKLLGISEELYIDKQKAKEWRNHIAKTIHPDVCEINGAAEAIDKLNEFYKSMTEEDGDGDE